MKRKNNKEELTIINDLQNDNKKLNKRVYDLEVQLEKTKEEIKVLQNYIFGFKDKAYIDCSSSGQKELYLSAPFTFYKLSTEELSCFETMNKNISVKKQSTPIEDFITTKKNGIIMLKQYIGNDVEVVVPDCISAIAPLAFENCKSIKSIVLPTSIKIISEDTFKNCINLTCVTIPDSATSICDRAFYNCRNLTKMFIPNSIKSIGGYAFCNCISLNSITLPDGIKEIDYSVFAYCSNLTGFIIPDSVKTISTYAFEHCINLTSITIPESVISIGNYAFANCNKLKIYCKEGTKAHTYAIENHIAYKLIDA